MAKQSPKKLKQPNVIDAAVTKQTASIKQVVERTEPRSIFVFLLCFVLGLVFYGNTMQNGYSLDDELVTLNQPNVEMGVAGIPKIFSSRYSVNTKQNYEYRPMVLVTFAIEYQFFGRNPGVSHFFNILVYAITCFLIYRTTRKIFNASHWMLAMLTCLIFLIHPMHNEVVASLKNRDEMLALIFGLCALNAFFDFVDRRKYRFILYGIGFLLLAAFSKKSVEPFIFLVPALIIFTRDVKWYKVVGSTFAILITFLVIGRLFISGMLDDKDVTQRVMLFFENPLFVGKHSWGEKMVWAIGTFGFYIKMMFAPWPLISYYGYNTFDGGHFGFYHAIGLAAIVGVIYLFIRFYKTDKPLAAGVAFFCISISMFVNLLVPAVGILAERFVFAASFGFALALAAAMIRLSKQANLPTTVKLSNIPKNLAVAFLAMMLASGIIVIRRNPDWASAISLYKADAASMPTSTKLYSLLGSSKAGVLHAHGRGEIRLSEYELRANTDTAISCFRKALEIYPEYTTSNNNLGAMYYTFRVDNDSAGYYFKIACQLDTQYVEGFYNLGNYYETKEVTAEQKAAWINWLPYDSTKPSNPKVFEEQLKKISAYEMTFDKIMTLKGTLNNAIRSIGAKKTNKEPKMVMLDALLLSYKNNKFIRDYDTNYNHNAFFKSHLKLADDLLNGIQVLSQSKEMGMVEVTVDSIINRYYFPVLTAAIDKDGKIKTSELDPKLRFYVQKQIEEDKKQCIYCLQKTLRLNHEYVQAYSKMVILMSRWNMVDELIALHTKMQKDMYYKQQTVRFNLADAYYIKGDYKKCSEYFIEGLKMVDKTMKRMNLVSDNFKNTSNVALANRLTQLKQAFKKTVSFYANKFMYQLSVRLPYETRQIQQLYNSINIL